MQERAGRRLLVFNCHEAWVYQLGVLGYHLDIVIGLKGRYKPTWDEQMRPLPPRSRLISLSEAVSSPLQYYCIIGHNITDLMDVKNRDEPRLMVIHSTFEGRAAEEHGQVDADAMKQMLGRYLDTVGAHAVATSQLKSRSWGVTDDVVPFGVDVNDYPQYSGEKACGLRICNFVESRRRILLWNFYEDAFSGVDVRLVGHNPGMAGVEAAANWSDLKQRRCPIHSWRLEKSDGYSGLIFCKIGLNKKLKDFERSSHAKAILRNCRENRQQKNRRISEQGWTALAAISGVGL